MPGATEPALPRCEEFECPLELYAIELGPQGLGEVELAVGQIPEQKIADSLFTTGSNQKIDRRQIRGRKCPGKCRLIYAGRVDATVAGLLGNQASRLNEIPTPAVSHGDDEIEPGIGCRPGLGGFRRLDQRLAQLVVVADKAQANAVRVELGDLAVERLEKQRHDPTDLVGGAIEILTRERKERQGLDAELGRNADCFPYRLDSTLVACGSRQSLALGPAAIAIHDDRQHGAAAPARPQAVRIWRPWTQFSSTRPTMKLEVHDFGFFLLKQRVDLSDILVGQLLDLLVSLVVLVLGDHLVLEHVLEITDRVAPDIADRNLAVLAPRCEPP